MRKLNKSKGFTLIELMVVVAIIGILAAVAVPKFMQFLARSRKSEARAILTGIFNAEEGYFSEYEWYGGGPTDNGVLWRIAYRSAGIPRIYDANYVWTDAVSGDTGGGGAGGVGTQQIMCSITTPSCITAASQFISPIGGGSTDVSLAPGVFAIGPPNGWNQAVLVQRGFTYVVCGNTDASTADFDSFLITQSNRRPCNKYDDITNIVNAAGECLVANDLLGLTPGAGC